MIFGLAILFVSALCGVSALAANNYQEHPDVRCLAISISIPITQARFKENLSTDLNLGVPPASIKLAYREHKDRIIDKLPDADQENAIELADALENAEVRRALESYQIVLNLSHFIELHRLYP